MANMQVKSKTTSMSRQTFCTEDQLVDYVTDLKSNVDYYYYYIQLLVVIVTGSV